MSLRGLVDPKLVATADVRRPVQTVGPGGQPTTNVGNSPVQIAGATVHVSKLSGGEAARAFGVDSDADYQVGFETGVDFDLNDLLVVTTGLHAGKVLEVRDILPGLGLMAFAAARLTTLAGLDVSAWSDGYDGGFG